MLNSAGTEQKYNITVILDGTTGVKGAADGEPCFAETQLRVEPIGVGGPNSLLVQARIRNSSTWTTIATIAGTTSTVVDISTYDFVRYNVATASGTGEVIAAGFFFKQASGGGSGTVTSVSVSTANGLSGTVANATTTPAITLNITALDAAKIADGSVSSAEFQFLDGVTSSIQTQLDAKGAGNALTSNPLSQFASTTSAQLAGVISDETGSGSLVFATSPTLVTPILGVATGTSFQGIVGNVTPAAVSATTVSASATVTLASNMQFGTSGSQGVYANNGSGIDLAPAAGLSLRILNAAQSAVRFSVAEATGATTIGGGLAVTGAISATGTATVGVGGTGAVSALAFIDGSSASTQGAVLRFSRNGALTGLIGTESYWAGNNSNNLMISGNTGNNVVLTANGSATAIATVSSTGLAVTGNVSATTNIVARGAGTVPDGTVSQTTSWVSGSIPLLSLTNSANTTGLRNFDWRTTGDELSAHAAANDYSASTKLLAISISKTLALQGATSATGCGIAFPATQVTSSDANTLDDYREASFTLTATGMTTSPTGTAKAVKTGNMVTMTLPSITGTSNTSAFTLTGVPSALRPASTVSCVLTVLDSGVRTLSICAILSDGSITLQRDIANTAFTSSGTKGIDLISVAYIV